MQKSQSEFTTKELVQDHSLKTIDKLTIIDDRQRGRPFDSQHIVVFDLVYQTVVWRCWWVTLVPFKEREFLGIVSLKESSLLMLTLTDSWTCHCSICPCFLQSELTSRFHRALKIKVQLFLTNMKFCELACNHHRDPSCVPKCNQIIIAERALQYIYSGTHYLTFVHYNTFTAYTSQYFCSARITLPPHMTASHEQLDPNCKLRTTNHERQITNRQVISLPIESDHNLIHRKSSRDSIPIDLERICDHPGCTFQKRTVISNQVKKGET